MSIQHETNKQCILWCEKDFTSRCVTLKQWARSPCQAETLQVRDDKIQQSPHPVFVKWVTV